MVTGETCKDPGLGWRMGMQDDSGMTTSVRGVIARAKGEPVEVTTVLVPDPGPGEARVRIQACGVCHTDLHYREGGIGEDFPYLLGHEAAGVVDAVGPGVTAVTPGDFVILNWPAATRVCSMKAPMPKAGDSGVPSSRVIFCAALCVAKQYHGRPRLQARHWPHTARQFRMTKSPGATAVTPGPTASTTPAASWPSK